MDFFIIAIVICFFIVVFKVVNSFDSNSSGEQQSAKKFLSPEEAQNVQKKLDNFCSDFERLKKSYIPHSVAVPMSVKYDAFFVRLKRVNLKSLDSAYIDKASKFLAFYSDFWNQIEAHNETFVEAEKRTCSNLFNLSGKRLDSQQQSAVVSDEDYNLVLAGAGSGKTLTITGKVKYLCERKGVKPENILLIAFAKKAAAEMTERISKQGYDVEAKTFHKLGLDIISKANGSRPDVLDDSELRLFLENYFSKKIIDNPTVIKALVEYFAFYLQIPGDIKKFNSLGAMYEHERNADLETLKSKYIKTKADSFAKEKRTLQGEFVKSLEEIQIANFLFINGINYEYEKKYPFPSDNPYRKSYTPDFYLTDYDIYLEHFGVNEDGKAPWLSEVEEAKYVAGMEWKREFHKKNSTKLLETYSWYNSRGILQDALTKMLKENGVEFKEANYRELYEKIFKDISNRYFKEFIRLCETFITLFKANGYKPDDLDDLQYKTDEYNNRYYKERMRLFKKVLKPILIEYNKMLKESGKVDFSDMILDATDIVNSGFKIPAYKYVIIDEFQDISVSRYKLVKAILEATGAHLLCVGDDWQSIYRFSGSDLGVFTDFEEYFGFTKIMKIEKTYRNSQELIDSASAFIMRNPFQMEKSLYSDKRTVQPLRFYVYQEKPYSAISVAIDEIIERYGKEKNILLLGRTRHDREVLIESHLFSVRKNNRKEVLVYKKNPDVNIEFMTVHKSKGLEADNVIILNFNNQLLGFPNKIADDPILELALSSADTFLYGEERRLLYVAMTRTKNEVAFIMNNDYPSEFLHDFENDKNVVLQNIDCDGSIAPVICPVCKTGRLVVRTNESNKNKFAGCSNYPHCTYTVNDISVLNSPIKCSCGGFMLLKKGRYGRFYGCSNYPFCDKTINIDDTDWEDNLQKSYPVKNTKTVQSSSPKEMSCICGGKMVLRNGKYGPFYGCSNYPRCHRIKNINSKSHSGEENQGKGVFNYCSVKFGENGGRYYYIADDITIEIGDYVVVPAGKDNHESIAKVTKIEYFSSKDAPRPFEKTKHIIRKCTAEELMKYKYARQ